MQVENRRWIDDHIQDLKIPKDIIFEQLFLNDGGSVNKQTDDLCKLIGIQNQIDL